MTYALVALIVLAIVVQGALFWAMDARRRAPGPPPPGAAPTGQTTQMETPRAATLELLLVRLGAVEADVAALKVTVQGLPQLWEESADRAERAAEKARKAAQRARAQREPDPALEPEDDGAQLQLEDGARGENGGVLPMRARVAPGLDEQMARARQVAVQAMLRGS